MMKKSVSNLLFAASVGLGALLGTGTVAFAAPAPADEEANVTESESALAARTYERTCWNISKRRGQLCARCRTRAGGARRTCLNQYRRCSGDISNRNGWLVCERW
ncbi:hypothetical protein [Polyangium fumosum]|uniref:High-potential iron-sulfur protein n=1 Tax=Polyangium fumosum TaxID=889272 RepID=A0A4U1IGT7_9BACT|nr:hypothetical protein [Polyangium fumosum]TKC92994.1 hypothetical protein E8A74_50195 [Polyangium fumosum]